MGFMIVADIRPGECYLWESLFVDMRLFRSMRICVGDEVLFWRSNVCMAFSSEDGLLVRILLL